MASRFFAATEGHPLFLSELVRELEGNAALPGGEADFAHLPASVTAAIDVRLARLSCEARLLVGFAAVVGRGFDIEVLNESTALGERQIRAGIAELLSASIVRESATRGSSYNFTHQLFQTRAYERIPEALRAGRHLRVARAIEKLYPDRRFEIASELAHHFEEAGEGGRAAECYALAARRALDLYANEDAVALATGGLERKPATATMLELLLAREEAFGRLGRRQAQGEDLARLEALAASGALDEIVNETLHRRIAFSRATNDLERERTAIAQLSSSVPSERWQARVQLAQGMHLHALGRYAEAGPILDDALLRFETLGDAAGIVDAALAIVRLYRNEQNYGGIRALLARVEGALDDRLEMRFVRAKLLEAQLMVEARARRFQTMSPLAERLLECSASIGHLEGEALAYRFLGEAAIWQLSVVRARDFLERAARIFEKIGDRHQSYRVLADSGIMSIFVGRFREAEAALLQAQKAASELDYGFGVAVAYVNLADCYNRSGSFERARSAAQRALKLYESLGTDAVIVGALVNLGVAQRGSGDGEAALATLTRAAALLLPETGDELSAEVYSQLALSQLGTGRTRECARTIERVLPLLDAVAAGFETMTNVYASTIVVLRGLDRSREADALASRARDLMQKYFRAIPDEETRAAFLGVAVHKALLGGAPRDFATCFPQGAKPEAFTATS